MISMMKKKMKIQEQHSHLQQKTEKKAMERGSVFDGVDDGDDDHSCFCVYEHLMETKEENRRKAVEVPLVVRGSWVNRLMWRPVKLRRDSSS